MSRIQIRRADIHDLGLITSLFDLYRQFYEQASDLAVAENFLAQRLQQNESVIFLALDGDAAVGFTQLYPGFSSVSMARTFLKPTPSERTWKPPLSVKVGPFQFINFDKPPASSRISGPGCKYK